MADPNMKDADRQALMQQMRDKMQALSPDSGGRRLKPASRCLRRRELEHIKQLLAMSPADRNNALDADIHRMEQTRSPRDAANANGAGRWSRAKRCWRTTRSARKYDRRPTGRSAAQSVKIVARRKLRGTRNADTQFGPMCDASSAGCRRLRGAGGSWLAITGLLGLTSFDPRYLRLSGMHKQCDLLVS